jgi:predicted secreted hydrolase
VIGGPWDASQLYLAHVALTDVAAGRHQEDERLSRGHPRLAGVSAAPFRAWLDDWTLTAAGDGLDSLTLRVDARGFAAELELTAQTPIVLQGDRGLSRKGPGQASYYYSLPRLAVAGRLTAAGVAYPVTGAAWLDREWSTSVLGDDQQGWDWFALHLEGQQDVMVYRLRRTDGARDPYDQGVWLDGGGRPQPLRAQDFTLTPQRWWTDGDGVRWPVAWDLAVLVPGGPRLLRVDAAVDDQRMDTLLRYWEGLVHVRDDSGRLVGRGYMELTGYE